MERIYSFDCSKLNNTIKIYDIYMGLWNIQFFRLAPVNVWSHGYKIKSEAIEIVIEDIRVLLFRCISTRTFFVYIIWYLFNELHQAKRSFYLNLISFISGVDWESVLIALSRPLYIYRLCSQINKYILLIHITRMYTYEYVYFGYYPPAQAIIWWYIYHNTSS